MTVQDLSLAIGEVREDYVTDAHARRAGSLLWQRLAVAACAALIAAAPLLWNISHAPQNADDPPPITPAAESGDYPVVYNELADIPSAVSEYSFAQFGAAITPEERAQILPEDWPEGLPTYLWGSVGRYGWGDVADVHLAFQSSDWASGLISVRLRPEEAPHDYLMVEEQTDLVPTHVEDQEVMLYRYRIPDGGELLCASFSRCGIDYSVQTNVEANQNESVAEGDFFQTIVCLVRGAREVNFSAWNKLPPYAAP